jgi:hypothetical protein
VLNCQTNSAISGAIVTLNGTNNTAPFNLGDMIAGNVLQATASAPGFLTESRQVTISNTAGNFRQQVTFYLSSILVKIVFFLIQICQ